ncbi:hypothetical protein V499_04110 [Pseudogymnoascus sp. VKM F-103]|nr:hypothetical protein V499_04110 [Pseudogymnoascus sp. VKM F-103]
MKLSITSQVGLAITAILSSTDAFPTKPVPQRQLLICSDSTTMPYGKTSLIQGWGFYMHNFFNLNITNLARGGRSTRSFINEGLWGSLVASIVPGEGTIVLIEMGHNDNGDPTTDTKFRATLPGIGHESVVVASNATGGTTERVYTFGHYLRKMISDVKHAGGVPILSGMVPIMSWNGGVLETDWAFADYEREVAEQEHVEYIDHTKYAVNRWQAFRSVNATAPYYPLDDFTHTSWPGAEKNNLYHGRAWWGKPSTVSGTEDCLYLGLYSRPWDASQPLRPVVVVYYGGAFIQGGGSFTLPPAGYPILNVSEANNFIFVYPNYRVNAFGFLPGAKIAADRKSDFNLGLLD